MSGMHFYFGRGTLFQYWMGPALMWQFLFFIFFFISDAERLSFDFPQIKWHVFLVFFTLHLCLSSLIFLVISSGKESRNCMNAQDCRTFLLLFLFSFQDYKSVMMGGMFNSDSEKKPPKTNILYCSFIIYKSITLVHLNLFRSCIW